MTRTSFRGGWMAATLATLLLAAPAAGQSARQRHSHSPPATAPAPAVEIIDGTPRGDGTRIIRPGAASAGRWTPPAPGDRTNHSLQAVNDHPGMASPLGGDDVLVASASPEYPLSPIYFQATSDGRLFAAWIPSNAAEILDVYRSVDGGETWTLWSSFPAPINALITDFVVADGDADRAFIAYYGWNGVTFEARIAWADLAAAPPVWTSVVAIEDPSFNVTLSVSLCTDAWGFSDYYLYVVAVADDGNGKDVWFARSFDFGASFEPEVKIGDVADSSFGFVHALVSTGFGDYAHVTMVQGGTIDNGLMYRRAGSYGDAPWETTVTLDALDDSSDPWPVSMQASPGNGTVAVVIGDYNAQCRYSLDSGATWPTSSEANTGLEFHADGGIAFAGTELIIGGHDRAFMGTQEFSLTRSATGDPAALSIPQPMSITTSSPLGIFSAIATVPAYGDRVAALWESFDATNRYLIFDAEWRRDPGYPNTDVGFPIAVAGGGQTPPAVAEVDGDPELEIVFGTISGDIHVVNHDGTSVPGWPVNIGAMAYDSPVAVGDLQGNGVPAIVAGNTQGEVYAFDPTGALMPGWPVVMNEADAVYVSIGALGPPYTRYVVATCGHEIRPITYLGSDVTVYPLWGALTQRISRPAAIGDIDNDGVTEVVTLKGEYYHAMVLGSAAPKYFRWFAGETFSDAPTLADMDFNGTLEIAAPTVDGVMHLLNYDGTEYSADWPVTVSAIPLTAVSFANILGNSEPELCFAEATGALHVRWYDGVEGSGYPKASGSSAIFTPPNVSPVPAPIPSYLNIGTTDGANGTAQSFSNFAATPAGWPRNLPAPVEETFASGDIDGDGRNELVVLGVDFLSVYDVGSAPSPEAARVWPMYGYDAQRTGCLACDEVLTGVGDTPKGGYDTALAIHPNPFNPSTTIEYEVATAGRVSLEVFDVTGARVATVIANEHREPGRYTAAYRATGASGVYFARFTSAGGTVTRKMVVLK